MFYRPASPCSRGAFIDVCLSPSITLNLPSTFYLSPSLPPNHHLPAASLHLPLSLPPSLSTPEAGSKLQIKLNLASSQTAVEYNAASKCQHFHRDSRIFSYNGVRAA